jgi:methionine aminotransferase
MAADCDAINLSQGFPDFSPPAGLLQALSTANAGQHHQYPPMMGIAPLRLEISRKIQALYGAEVNPDTEITVTSGATEALFVAIQAVVQQGDEVIVFDPAYDAYDPAITLAGGKAVHVNLAPDFSVNWQAVADAITPRTRAIVINTPHNPSATVMDAADLAALESLAERHDLFVISDEVYEHMVFDDAEHQSVLRSAALRQRSFAVFSFGKTYHATGWKVGYVVACPGLNKEFRKIHQYVTFTTHSPSQYALATFMAECPEHHENLSQFYQQKRDLFASLLEDSNFKLKRSAGTYFQVADYRAISRQDDVAFCEYLTREIGVAAIPMSVFYQSPPEQHLVRFCFAKDDATLRAAAEKLRQLEHSND